jgi:hypothetical protein
VPVTDHQVATLRAYVTGDLDEYKRMLSQFDRNADKAGWAALITAAFFEAVDRRFTNASDDIIEYVGSVRARSESLADELHPDVGERLIRHALGDGPEPDADGKTQALAQTLLLGALVYDSGYDDQELDEFLLEARRVANQLVE